jgi:hypothetical protein
VAQVTSEHISAFRGYQWLSAGAVVEMPDEEAAELLELAGQHGGYAIVPKKAARKPVTEPAPAAAVSEVLPEGNVTEGKSTPA